MPILNQKGIAPLVIILILAVTVIGGASVYKSSKKINIREDKTTETTGGNLYPQTPSAQVLNLANSGNLATAPVEVKVDQTSEDAPKFSITPPAGWEKLPENGNIIVEFLSPAKDAIEEGLAFIDIQSNITVFVAKGEYENLDAAGKAFSKGNYEKETQQKSIINGEEALVTESVKDVSELLKGTIEEQIKSEIAKSKTKISDNQLKADINKVLEQAKIKMISYSFYNNGYYINVTGKSLESFWDKRGLQLKKSMDTFKFE